MWFASNDLRRYILWYFLWLKVTTDGYDDKKQTFPAVGVVGYCGCHTDCLGGSCNCRHGNRSRKSCRHGDREEGGGPWSKGDQWPQRKAVLHLLQSSCSGEERANCEHRPGMQFKDVFLICILKQLNKRNCCKISNPQTTSLNHWIKEEELPRTFQEIASTVSPNIRDYDFFPAQPTIKTHYVDPANVPPEFLPPQYRDEPLVDLLTASYGIPWHKPFKIFIALVLAKTQRKEKSVL